MEYKLAFPSQIHPHTKFRTLTHTRESECVGESHTHTHPYTLTDTHTQTHTHTHTQAHTHTHTHTHTRAVFHTKVPEGGTGGSSSTRVRAWPRGVQRGYTLG